MIKIDKHVPIPQKSTGPAPKYPWATMVVGDSFFAPIKRTAMSSSVAYATYRWKRQFLTRTEKKGTRVWRIA